MSKSRFDTFNSFIRKRHRLIIVAWMVAIILSLILIPSFFSSVSYNIANTNFGGNQNSESQLADNIVTAQFPSSATGSNSSIIVVLQSSQVYSDAVKQDLFSLNQSLSTDPGVGNFTGMQSVFSTEYSLLNSTVPSFLPAIRALSSNITTINSGLYSLRDNLSSFSSGIFALEGVINQSAQLIYGVPSIFAGIWASAFNGTKNAYTANQFANSTMYNDGYLANPEAIGYYSIFFNIWNSSFASQQSLAPQQRESLSINQTVPLFLNNVTDPQAKATFSTVWQGLNLTTFTQSSAIVNLTLSTIQSQIPSNLSSSLGVTPYQFVKSIYDLGTSPSNSSLGSLAVSLFSNSLSQNSTQGTSGFTLQELINDSYNLGVSPSEDAMWNLASGLFANATASSFASSPLFTVNATSLHNFLSTFNNSTTSAQAQSAALSLTQTESFQNYPYVLSRSLTKNFVSPTNDTMIVLFNFSTVPDKSVITLFSNHVKSSGIESLGTIYVTGSPVITQDVSDAFTPALGDTVGPGVGVSLLIVGLLFLAPAAALLPIIIGGVSIVIAYAAIYAGIVKIGHGTITFLTPTLVTLLMLGLAVDYCVLQLRRTREERQKGRTKEEAVATSVRWAGEAVLTAGITVVVAYIVMAVANVPLFSDVGTAIALGVSILLAASLTLLPSLELAFGDRLFWPGLRINKNGKHKVGRLDRLGEKTLRRKVAVAAVISLFAAGAFYIGYGTPTGVDLLKLIPNFPSNQGLTVITNSLGSGVTGPSTVVVTTSTPIVYGNNQFNQTLLGEIESISSAVANSNGVVTVTGPTRPFGSTFNYSSIQGMSEPEKAQYLSGMVSQIGKNNKTALILVGLSNSAQSPQAVTALLNMEENVKSLSLPSGVTIYFGGETQATYDTQSFINGILPEVVIVLSAAVYVILLLQLRSAFTPLRLVFTILCSVSFALALLSLTFYYALQLPILNFAPLFVVVTMLGVGIDYDIFFVTRIREEVLGGMSDNDAIKTAITKVWVTIFGLGLILSSVFGALLLTNIAMLQEISLTVASAILVDVGVVILFFVPSLMALAEKFNWWPSKSVKRAQRAASERNPPGEE